MTAAARSLDRLPDDLLYLVLADLDTARDLAHVGTTCRRLHRFLQDRGWRAFARRCFPGAASEPASGAWDRRVDSLTWQVRAWDRRALSFQALLPRDTVPARRQRRQTSFRPPLAVHFRAAGGQQPGGGVAGEELVVWGAGEDIVARYRRRGTYEEEEEEEEMDDQVRARRENDDNDDDPAAVARWRVLDGKAAGFRPGYDDVRGLAVVPHGIGRLGQRGILAGRDNGDLALLAGEDRAGFGRVLARFAPAANDAAIQQDRIYSLDVAAAGRAFGGLDNRGGLAAVATTSHIVLYGLPGGDTTDDATPQRIAPVAALSMGGRGLDSNRRRRPYSVRWMAADGLAAVGLGYHTDQLSFLTATPAGLTLQAAAKSAALQRRFALDDDTLLLPSSLQPLRAEATPGGGGALLLSAWRDGTCRLQDLRTPSPWDLAYQDNLAPSQCFQSLLVCGADRFIAGSQESAALKIFDLRWPRRYHHTTALPCGSHPPFPDPDPDRDRNRNRAGGPRTRARCDPLTGALCTWHTGSRRLAARPNCSIYLQRSAVSRYPDIGVWSLAQAPAADGGDAPNFYAGLNSCVVEAVLAADGAGDPHLAFPDVLRQRPLSLVAAPPPEHGVAAADMWRRRQAALQHRHHYYRTVDLQWHLHEIGDGLADPHNDRRPRRLAMMRLSRPAHLRRGTALRSETLDRPADGTLLDLDPHRVRPQPLSALEADIDPVLRVQHRLDDRLQGVADFVEFYAATDE